MQPDSCSDSSFSAVLVPHKSLSRSGFWVIICGTSAICLSAGLAFAWIGAWPVFGFLGLDVALIYWALDRSLRNSQVRETIDVFGGEMVLRRMHPGRPVEEHRFVRNWVRVQLEEDVQRELIGKLSLLYRGARFELGNFLAPDDRRSLAHALRSVIAA